MIIYLDFDGVLHPDAVYSPRNRPLELRAPGQLFMHAHLLVDALAPYPGLKIVLSTSWIWALGFQKTLRRMPAELATKVIGATYPSGYETFQSMTRFQQIKGHVYRNELKHWIAIDDLHSGDQSHLWPDDMRNRLVLTDGVNGLGCPETQADLKIKLQQLSLEVCIE